MVVHSCPACGGPCNCGGEECEHDCPRRLDIYCPECESEFPCNCEEK